MKINAILFWVLTGFFGLSAVVYGFWTYINSGVRVEWTGTVALALATALAAFIGFYLSRVLGAQTEVLPEDRSDANIDDGDPELGFFSPWSWWPLTLALGCGTVFLGLAAGFWLAILGVFVTVIALVGWTYEYYRGYFAR